MGSSLSSTEMGSSSPRPQTRSSQSFSAGQLPALLTGLEQRKVSGILNLTLQKDPNLPYSRIIVLNQVDDVPSQQDLICKALEQAGYVVTRANDGDEVLQKIEKDMPNLVVMDVVMERMNGFETLREIRDNPKTKRLPVVICSTKNTDFDKSWGADLGADAYITKPFEPEQLVSMVQRLL